MEEKDLQTKMLAALIQVARSEDATPHVAMGDAIGAGIRFMILVSETAGRNTLRDLYYTRRRITEIIKEYKTNGTV